jgi:hypothetical protein
MSVAFSIGQVEFDVNGIALIPDEDLHVALLAMNGYKAVKEGLMIPSVTGEAKVGEASLTENKVDEDPDEGVIDEDGEETTDDEEDPTLEEKTDTEETENEVIDGNQDSVETEEVLESEEEMKERYNSYNNKRLELLVKKKGLVVSGSKKKDLIDALVANELKTR